MCYVAAQLLLQCAVAAAVLLSSLVTDNGVTPSVIACNY
jgi:hypothetical protein